MQTHTELYQASMVKGKLLIRIEHKRFYMLYKRYMRDNYPSSKARNIDTVFKELLAIGIVRHPKRRILNAKKYHVVDIVYADFMAKMQELYPNLQVCEWDSESEPKAFITTLQGHQDSPW